MSSRLDDVDAPPSSRSYDAGKKVKGRKRHLVTDMLGLLLAVTVLSADIQDRDAALPIARQACLDHPTIEAFIVDSGYSGKCAQLLRDSLKVEVEVVRRPQGQKGWITLPKRWIIERTNAWTLRFRRLIVDHDRKTSVSESWIWLAQSSILLNRLGNHS